AAGADGVAARAAAWRHPLSREEHDVLLPLGDLDCAERGALGDPLSHQPPQALGCGIVPGAPRLAVFETWPARTADTGELGDRRDVSSFVPPIRDRNPLT